MRQSFNGGILKNGSKVIAINLGADYCAEHEWGIKRLRDMLGMKETGYGIEKRVMTRIPENLFFGESKDETVLIVGGYQTKELTMERFKSKEYRSELSRYSKDDTKLIAAWDEGSFGISGKTKEDREAIALIYRAIQNNNLALWLGGGGIFENAGLVVAIKDVLPKDKLKIMYDADLDKEKLLVAAESTGIYKKLKDANCGYFACSPRWADKKENTKHPVIFWLNPQDQQNNEYGWYTVEELELWAQKKGPVIEKSRAKRGKR